MAGNHVPLIPLIEVECKIGAILPLQILFDGAKVGNNFSVIVCVSEVKTAHWFASGVKV